MEIKARTYDCGLYVAASYVEPTITFECNEQNDSEEATLLTGIPSGINRMQDVPWITTS